MSALKNVQTGEKSLTRTLSSENISSIPIDQEEENDVGFLSVDLLHRMDIEDIRDLKKYFFDEDRINKSDSKHLQENLVHGLPLSKAEFIEALERLSGSTLVAFEAAALFDSLDVSSKGTLRWGNVLNAIITRTKEPLERESDGWQPVDSNVEIKYATHCKRENIVKIVPLYTKLTFCYAVISKLGRVGVYDGEFNLLDTYKVALKPTLGTEFLTGEQEERQKRSKTTWITDAVFVPDTYALFFSASDCSLHLYDATGLIHVPLCLISGVKNMPTCMDYYSNNVPGKSSLLFFGDEVGNVTVMQFHQPKKTLFKKKDPDKLDKFLWSRKSEGRTGRRRNGRNGDKRSRTRENVEEKIEENVQVEEEGKEQEEEVEELHQMIATTELKEQADYVTYFVQRKVHDDAVLQISYSSETQTVLTCSNDPVKTMALRHLEKRREPYIFKIPKGVKCFHLDKSLHIIVTGSRDGLVRIWNQVVTKQPIISLHGHRAPIVDVRVLKHMSAIISLSEKAVVKIWSLDDYYCQMTLPLNFPVFKVLGSKIEFGTRSIFPGPSATDIFDELNILKASEGSKINSLTEEIETWLTTREFEIGEDEEWSRNTIVVTCCNFVALLRLQPFPSEKGDDGMPELLRKYKLLPPPAREHYASIPTPWKVADFFTRTPPEESDDSSTGKSSTYSSNSRSMPISKAFKKVQNMTADPVKAPMKNMNTKRTQFKIKQEQMKMLVEHCAPHLALDLHDLAPIKFSRPLPRSRQMIEKGIDVSDPEQVIKGKLPKDSTLTGETASEEPSQLSSKSSKLPAAKKPSQPPKGGRQTPDWFTEKIKSSRRDSSGSSNGSKSKSTL